MCKASKKWFLFRPNEPPSAHHRLGVRARTGRRRWNV